MVRQARGLSLAAVASLSDGAFKANIVGAYERDERAITVQRLEALAVLYGVPPRMFFADALRTVTFSTSAGSTSEVAEVFEADGCLTAPPAPAP